MGLASELKNLGEEMISSYKQRVRENEELVIEVQKTLDGFRKDHQDMAVALRAGLNKDEKTRLKEFVPFMKNIKVEVLGIFTNTHDLLAKFVKEIQEMSVEVHDLLAKFDKEHQAKSVELRKDLAKGEVERLKEFAPLMPGIRKEISEIFTFTHDLLAKFDKEHQDMAVALRAGLDKDEKTRLKEFIPFMKGIQNDVKDLRNAVQVELGEASAAWKKMSDILAQLRKTAVTPPKQVVKKEVKPTPVAAVKEIPVEAIKEIPVEVQPKVGPKPVVPMTLEEKVMDFINKHPKGVRISEMEEPLGETRMKLGFIAKNLLNEGKVL
ncbi:MAG: hypothetical protein Q8N38_00130, partial [Bacteroidales bacterium]|nr:hypothetical protein [Bacteroidales bacterium]